MLSFVVRVEMERDPHPLHTKRNPSIQPVKDHYTTTQEIKTLASFRLKFQIKSENTSSTWQSLQIATMNYVPVYANI